MQKFIISFLLETLMLCPLKTIQICIIATTKYIYIDIISGYARQGCALKILFLPERGLLWYFLALILEKWQKYDTTCFHQCDGNMLWLKFCVSKNVIS